MNGWIKLHRQMLSWEWFKDSNAYRVFTYLLLSANHKAGSWRGMEVLSGQHITSAEIIAQNLGLTRQMVRTAINKLKSTGEITTSATSKYTLVTIVKWAFYQSGVDDGNQVSNHNPNHEATINQPALQPQNNHKQEVKEIKNDKNVRSGETPAPPTAVREGSPSSLSQPVGFEENKLHNDNHKQADIKTANEAEKAEITTIRNNYVFHGELEQAVNNWLTYKQEKRQQYKPSGLNSLLSQVQKHANTYGEDAVVHAINESMASNYQGIVWDKAKNISNKRDSPQQKGNPFLAYARELEEQEKHVQQK